jgi:CubicO group peptidase (beta-lactamase class C family)
MMISVRPTLSALAILLTSLTAVPGAERTHDPLGPKTFDLQAIDNWVGRQVQEKGFVGLSLAILQDGKLVFAKGYGKSDLKAGTPVEPTTAFGVGSITKQFTCACILLLAEEGKLSVRDPVAKYYPDVTRAKDITLYDLMTHTSGYVDYSPYSFLDPRQQKPAAADQIIRDFAGRKLEFEPGSRYSYSNTGYLILGRVVEKVSGEPFGKFLGRRILKPVGMEHSSLEPAQDGKGVSFGYTGFMLGPPELSPPEADAWNHAAGGLYASASDLAKWDLALMSGKVLKEDSFRLMTTARHLSDGRIKNYGCGQRILNIDGETVLRHTGSVSGFLAYNAMIPGTKSAVVLLVNADHIEGTALHDHILSLLLEEQAGRANPVPKVHGPAPLVVAYDLLRQMQDGAVDRDRLGPEYSQFLTAEKIANAKERLKALGEPSKIEVVDLRESAGMEAADVLFTFKTVVVKASLLRSPDGKIQEFLLSRE